MFGNYYTYYGKVYNKIIVYSAFTFSCSLQNMSTKVNNITLHCSSVNMWIGNQYPKFSAIRIQIEEQHVKFHTKYNDTEI